MNNNKLQFSEFTEAFIMFLIHHCTPYLPGGGEIGVYNPKYIHSEIRIVLNEFGGGYIHLLGQDSKTMEFRTMDHFRSQGMITPEQREKIDALTCAKATKLVRVKNKELQDENKKLQDTLQKLRETLASS